jgi:hypothetical protein
LGLNTQSRPFGSGTSICQMQGHIAVMESNIYLNRAWIWWSNAKPDLTFTVHCSLIISCTTKEELESHLSSRAECVWGL